MPLPFGKPEKEKAIRRAKALGELLLPCLAFALIVLLSAGFAHARPAPVPTNATAQIQTGQDGWPFANTASPSDPTTATTYTALGTF